MSIKMAASYSFEREQRLCTISRKAHKKVDKLQLQARHLPVDRLVVDNQNALASVASATLLFDIDRRCRLGYWRCAGLFQLHGKPEGAADLRHTVHASLSPHQFGQTPGNRKAQAGAAVLAVSELSACSKTLNSRGMASGGMPMPVS